MTPALRKTPHGGTQRRLERPNFRNPRGVTIVSTDEYLDIYLANEPAFGPSFRKFSMNERRAMLQDDLFAGRSVSGVLLAIVTGGMLLMLATVLLTLI